MGRAVQTGRFREVLIQLLPSLDVFTHEALPSGWKWTCERHSLHRSQSSVDQRSSVAKL